MRMSPLQTYRAMLNDHRVTAAQLNIFRRENGIYLPGDKVVYIKVGGPNAKVMTVQSTTPVTMKPLRLIAGRVANLRVSGKLRFATAEEIQSC